MKTLSNFRFASLIILFTLFTGVTANAQKSNITLSQLPATAQDFLKKHFPKQTPNYILKDEETFSLDYKVQLAVGTEIEFERKGNWEEIVGNERPIPNTVVPATIVTYIQKNYKGASIVKIDKGTWDYEVDLDNGLELKFNKSGEFLRIDK